MANYIVLYNPMANNGKGEENARKLDEIKLDRPAVYRDVTGIRDYAEFFASLDEEDGVILCGGDGTLNRFINDTSGLKITRDIYYFASGTGNDFLHDVGGTPGDKPLCINDYIKDLPYVTVNGKTYRFLNNVGFGIDGYCTEVGDEMRAAHKENINYTAIAIKGLLGGFHPVNAEVTVDGKTERFKKAWLAPTMKGRYYGGGMMETPQQNRSDPAQTLSVMIFYGKGKLKTLMAFPSIFQGEHVKHTDMVKILTGTDVKVKFDRPCPLQIDGETVRGVTEYHARAASVFTETETEPVSVGG